MGVKSAIRGPAAAAAWAASRVWASLAALAIAAAVGLPARAADCAGLARLAVAGTNIVSAAISPPGPMTVPAAEWTDPPRTRPLPAFCRVRGVADPGIGFEVWLPAAGWNGRLLSVGNGGLGGSIRLDALADGLIAGYAVTSNDTGHQGEDRTWMRDPDKVRTWGHTATHLTTAPAKALVAAYYGASARYAYFAGCSTGGAQAMEEAQFYPGDYDGVVAGAPGMSYAHLILSFLWGLKAASAYPDSLIPPDKLALLHRAVEDQCGDPAGKKLSILDDPLACHFDPRRLQCQASDGPVCLTAHQVQTALAIYQGPRNPRTGAQIYPGLAYGSEFSDKPGQFNALAYGWGGIQGPLAQAFAIPILGEMVFHDADWDWRTFDWDHDVDTVDRRVAEDITALNPDLRAFAAHGGKLIIYQGWGDPINGQTLPIDYRAAVIAKVQRDQGVSRGAAVRDVDGFLRLFMAPGMAHCVGGPGPNRFDALNAVRAWVETDTAPDVLIATRPAKPDLGGSFTRPVVRPLCAYPAIARWTGAGDANRPDEFTCTLDADNGAKASDLRPS
jgi:feruloyl esterase